MAMHIKGQIDENGMVMYDWDHVLGIADMLRAWITSGKEFAMKQRAREEPMSGEGTELSHTSEVRLKVPASELAYALKAEGISDDMQLEDQEFWGAEGEPLQVWLSHLERLGKARVGVIVSFEPDELIKLYDEAECFPPDLKAMAFDQEQLHGYRLAKFAQRLVEWQDECEPA